MKTIIFLFTFLGGCLITPAEYSHPDSRPLEDDSKILIGERTQQHYDSWWSGGREDEIYKDVLIVVDGGICPSEHG